MNAILLLTFFLPFLHCDEKEKTTTVYFEQTEWNFGEIQETDGKVTHRFKYCNSGENPLIFYSVKSSCGCTTPTYSKDPLSPKDSSEFIVTYDPVNRPGRFEKYIVIQGNMEGGTVVLKIKGVVEPRARGIEDDYPIALSKGIRLSETQINAGAMPNTISTRLHTKFYNTSDSILTIGFVKEDCPDWLEVEDSKSIPPKSSLEMEVTIIPEKNMWGRISYLLPVTISGKVQPIEIYVLADLVEDFSLLTQDERNNAPYIILSSYYYSFSDAKLNEELKRDFKLTNRGKSPLIIRYLDYNREKISVKLDKLEINPGETVLLNVSIDSSTAEDIAEVIRIISNDPVYPVREIRVIANIH